MNTSWPQIALFSYMYIMFGMFMLTAIISGCYMISALRLAK